MSTKRKIRQKSHVPVHKCIYCQQKLTKKNKSKEHLLNKSLTPSNNHQLTLVNKVCANCNSNFGVIDKSLVENTFIGFNRFVMDVVNDENRWHF